MKQGLLNIEELANEVQRQRNVAQDFTVPVGQMRVAERADGGGAAPLLAVRLTGMESFFGINELAHDQIGDFAKIPAAYYDDLRASDPELFALNVNRRMARAGGTRLVRTLDGNARAFLSNTYRPIDNVGLMEHVLPVLFERPDLQFASAQITERRLYLKVVSTAIVGAVKPGDEVRAGIVISNSEVGAGAYEIAPFTERLVCTNGAVHTKYGQRKAHLGRKLSTGELAAEFKSDETRAAEDRALFLGARDVIKGILSGDTLGKILADMRAATEDKITGDVEKTVDAVAQHVQLNEAERSDVLRNLIAGADLSRWGVANAVTRTAQDAASYDRATELEEIGGRLIDVPLASIAPAKVRARRTTRRPAELVVAN